MNRRVFLPSLYLIASISFLASPLPAQWQKVGNEQLPDHLEADSLTTPTLRAGDTSGIALRNSDDQLGVFVGAGGNLGFGESDLQSWSTSFRAIEFGPMAAFLAGPAEVHVLFNAYHDGEGWRRIGEDYASGYSQTLGGHSFRVSGSSAGAGSAIEWIEALEIANTGNLRIGSPVRLEIEADQGSVASEGAIDFEGGAEFGSDAHSLTVYRSASEAMFAPAVLEGIVHDSASDAIHPATSGAFEYASLPCPWTAPGTRVHSAKFVVRMETSADRCNFSIRRQSSASPGTTVDIVPFGGADYGSSAGLTNLSGDYYERIESIDRTVAAGEKIWAVVRLKGDSTGNGAQLLGVEWTFEKRTY